MRSGSRGWSSNVRHPSGPPIGHLPSRCAGALAEEGRFGYGGADTTWAAKRGFSLSAGFGCPLQPVVWPPPGQGSPFDPMRGLALERKRALHIGALIAAFRGARVAARSPMSGASEWATETAERGHARLVQSQRAIRVSPALRSSAVDRPPKRVERAVHETLTSASYADA